MLYINGDITIGESTNNIIVDIIICISTYVGTTISIDISVYIRIEINIDSGIIIILNEDFKPKMDIGINISNRYQYRNPNLHRHKYQNPYQRR